MALPLLPALTVGTTTPTSSNLLAYLDGQTYGVQAAPVGTSDDMRGINEDFRFLRDAYDWAMVEHDANGVHDTLQIARGLLIVEYDDNLAAYAVQGHSYLLGTYENEAPGLFTISSASAGEITVTLATALPSATAYAVADLSGSIYDSTDNFLFVRTQLRARTSASIFTLRRWQATTVGGLALADGPFAILIYGEA